MSHYLFTGRYTTQAIGALVATPQDRKEAAESLCASLGATLHQAYMMMGEDDFILIFEAPDDKTAASVALALGAGGALSSGRTTKLLTTEEAMASMEKAKSATYKPPKG